LRCGGIHGGWGGSQDDESGSRSVLKRGDKKEAPNGDNWYLLSKNNGKKPSERLIVIILHFFRVAYY
jgi:hypothetical protein